jgi:hypothetical protein
MGHKWVFDFGTAGNSLSPWNAQKALTEALAEKASFLKKNPALSAYQEQIDRILENAGSAENRMAVLALLMEAKLGELTEQMVSLHRLIAGAAL